MNTKNTQPTPTNPTSIIPMSATECAAARRAPDSPKPYTPPPRQMVKPVTVLDKVLLLKVFKIQNPSRNRACNNAAMDTITSLAPAGCTIVRNAGNMLIRKGPAYGVHPFFLAHMDQVHDYVPYMALTIRNGVLAAVDGNGKQTGVGGDDKCGIYLALHMLHTLDHCTAVFVRDEEVGCLGSGVVPLSWFSTASFVLQADRNNSSFDIIRSTNGMSCASEEFMDAILDLPACQHHKENTGSITDIGELACRELPVSAVNISSGYHNPHSSSEVVKLAELRIACDVAYQMATLHGNVVWGHTPTEDYAGYGYGAYMGGYSGTLNSQGYGGNHDQRGGYDAHFKGGSSTAGMTADEIQEWMWETSEVSGTNADYREYIIAELVDTHALDRDLDALEHQTTETLEQLLEEYAEIDPDSDDDNDDEDYPHDDDPRPPVFELDANGVARAVRR